MENTEILEGWAILDQNTISENDFLLWNLEEKTLNDYLENVTPDNPSNFYDQADLKRTRNWCTLFWSFGAVTDLTWHIFSKEEILEIHNIAEKKYWWKENHWGYIYRAVDCVRNYWNTKNPWKEIISFRVDLRSQKDLDLIVKLYKAKKTLVIWYKTTTEHWKDSQDNWILDKDCFVSCGAKVHWGHCIRYNHWLNIDNYINHKKHNSYINEKLVKLSKEGTYFPSAYVYFYKEDFETWIFKDVLKDDAFYGQIKNIKDKWIIHWYPDWTFKPNKTITRGEMAVVANNILNYIDKKLWQNQN